MPMENWVWEKTWAYVLAFDYISLSESEWWQNSGPVQRMFCVFHPTLCSYFSLAYALVHPITLDGFNRTHSPVPFKSSDVSWDKTGVQKWLWKHGIHLALRKCKEATVFIFYSTPALMSTSQSSLWKDSTFGGWLVGYIPNNKMIYKQYRTNSLFYKFRILSIWIIFFFSGWKVSFFLQMLKQFLSA